MRVLGCARARRSATCVQRNISRCHRWMAHILYCLQHKLRRGTRAVKCSVPATSSRILLVLSLFLSLSLFVTKYTQTDCFHRCDGRSEDTLPYSSRRLGCFRGQPKRWKETKSTSRFLGRTRWVNVCVFVCTNRVATRYKYASVFVRIVMYGFVVMYDEYT